MVVTQILPAPIQISSQFAFEVCICLAHVMNEEFVENVSGHIASQSTWSEADTDLLFL